MRCLHLFTLLLYTVYVYTVFSIASVGHTTSSLHPSCMVVFHPQNSPHLVSRRRNPAHITYLFIKYTKDISNIIYINIIHSIYSTICVYIYIYTVYFSKSAARELDEFLILFSHYLYSSFSSSRVDCSFGLISIRTIHTVYMYIRHPGAVIGKNKRKRLIDERWQHDTAR